MAAKQRKRRPTDCERSGFSRPACCSGRQAEGSSPFLCCALRVAQRVRRLRKQGETSQLFWGISRRGHQSASLHQAVSSSCATDCCCRAFFLPCRYAFLKTHQLVESLYSLGAGLCSFFTHTEHGLLRSFQGCLGPSRVFCDAPLVAPMHEVCESVVPPLRSFRRRAEHGFDQSRGARSRSRTIKLLRRDSSCTPWCPAERCSNWSECW